mgnify:FL=1
MFGLVLKSEYNHMKDFAQSIIHNLRDDLEYERKKTLYWMCKYDGTVGDDVSFEDWVKRFDEVREENKQWEL